MSLFKSNKKSHKGRNKKGHKEIERQAPEENTEDEYGEYGGLDPLIIKNMEYAKKHLHLSEPFGYDENNGYVPTGCRACGGDYPLCRQGCPLFDED